MTWGKGSNKEMQGFLETLGKPEEGEFRQLTLRNYIPKSRELKQFVRPASTLVGETEIEIMHDVRASISEFHRQQAEPLNVIPKRPNWDLKRDLGKKLETLERRTEAALAELLRENLKREKEGIGKGEGNGNDDEPNNPPEGATLLKAIDLQSRLDLASE